MLRKWKETLHVASWSDSNQTAYLIVDEFPLCLCEVCRFSRPLLLTTLAYAPTFMLSFFLRTSFKGKTHWGWSKRSRLMMNIWRSASRNVNVHLKDKCGTKRNQLNRTSQQSLILLIFLLPPFHPSPVIITPRNPFLLSSVHPSLSWKWSLLCSRVDTWGQRWKFSMVLFEERTLKKKKRTTWLHKMIPFFFGMFDECKQEYTWNTSPSIVFTLTSMSVFVQKWASICICLNLLYIFFFFML